MQLHKSGFEFFKMLSFGWADTFTADIVFTQERRIDAIVNLAQMVEFKIIQPFGLLDLQPYGYALNAHY